MATSVAGFGTASLGVFPFGIGTPATATAPPDPPTGAPYIDPRTRDYHVEEDGAELSRMPVTRQRVLLAVTQTAGSSTLDPGRGIRRPPRIGKGYARQAETDFRRALAPLVADGSITIEGVDVQIQGFGRVVHTVRYLDLRAGRSDEVRLG